jgi:hypothetical protein
MTTSSLPNAPSTTAKPPVMTARSVPSRGEHGVAPDHRERPSATARTSRSLTRASMRRPTRVEAVVVGVEAQEGVGRDAQRSATVRVRGDRGQRRHHLALLEQPVNRPSPQRRVHARVGALVEAPVGSSWYRRRRAGPLCGSRRASVVARRAATNSGGSRTAGRGSPGRRSARRHRARVATARDHDPAAARVCPWPTAISRASSQRSNWQISPGR